MRLFFSAGGMRVLSRWLSVLSMPASKSEEEALPPQRAVRLRLLLQYLKTMQPSSKLLADSTVRWEEISKQKGREALRQALPRTSGREMRFVCGE